MSDEPVAVEGQDDDSGHACPECGQEFATPLLLGAHRRFKHGVTGSSKRARRERESRARGENPRPSQSRSRGETRQARRAKAIHETLTEFLQFRAEVRGEETATPELLADVIRRDSKKIADALAWAAERVNPLGRLVDVLAGHGGPVTFLRGFLGVAGWTVRKWRQGLAERELQEQIPQDGYPDTPQGDPVPGMDLDATPV